MILERGNMWNVFGKTDLFLITTNPIITIAEAVVMGRGLAKEIKDRYPDLPYDFAKQLKAGYANVGYIGKYDHQRVGWFMVKSHWQEPAELEIINKSVEQLTAVAMFNKHWRIDLNFPGIGNGKLKRQDVLPIIEQLPDNVHVWEY